MKKLLFTCLILAGCASPYKVEKLTDTKLQEKGTVGNSVIGINGKQEAVVQTVTPVEKELSNVIWWNNNKEAELEESYAMLKRCRKELSDPRLGGSDRVKVPKLKRDWDEKLKERTGLVGEDLVVVKEQYLKERLTLEKEKGQYFESMIDTVKDSLDDCEVMMGSARVKAGLPATRYQGKIKVTPEGNVGEVIAPNENSLDDAFRIKESQGQ